MDLIKISKTILVTVLVSASFFACEDYEFLGNEIREVRNLKEFDKLQLSTVGKVYLKNSPDYRIEIWTHEGVLDNIDTYVDGNETLQVQLHGHFKKMKNLEYYVYMPYLSRLTLNGVCDVFCYEGFETDHLTIDQQNVGKIRLQNLYLDNIAVNLNDVGDIILSGMVTNGDFVLSGVGNIDAMELNTLHARATLTGVGDIALKVTDSLEIFHSGVGKVYYKGNPAVEYHGDGHVIHVFD